MFADMRSVKKLAPITRRYALTLPNGAEVFSEFSTVEAYMANQAAEKQLVATVRRDRIWAGMNPEVRKPLVDRRKISVDGRGQYVDGVLRPEPIANKTASTFGVMIAAEMQKAGL